MVSQLSTVAMRNFSVQTGHPEWPALPVLLFYPSEAPARRLQLGPFAAELALGAALPQRVKGLILISHGSGGSQLVHVNTAHALAKDGYLVAAVEHGGDSYRSTALMDAPDYFAERPRQIRAVLQALLRDAQWGPILEQCPVGALGHSAGGGTVLTLAGARPDVQRLWRHCQQQPEDRRSCAIVLPDDSAASVAAAKEQVLIDEREPLISAVAALAPIGAVFDSASLASIAIPVRIYCAEQDDVLPSAWHAQYLAQHLPFGAVEEIPGAGHFAFMSQSDTPLPSPAGDAAANPAGFDRRAWLVKMDRLLIEFFNRSLNAPQ